MLAVLLLLNILADSGNREVSGAEEALYSRVCMSMSRVEHLMTLSLFNLLKEN